MIPPAETKVIARLSLDSAPTFRSCSASASTTVIARGVVCSSCNSSSFSIAGSDDEDDDGSGSSSGSGSGSDSGFGSAPASAPASASASASASGSSNVHKYSDCCLARSVSMLADAEMLVLCAPSAAIAGSSAPTIPLFKRDTSQMTFRSLALKMLKARDLLVSSDSTEAQST